MHACMHTTYTHTHMHARTHACTHTRTHAHTHTVTCMYTHVGAQMKYKLTGMGMGERWGCKRKKTESETGCRASARLLRLDTHRGHTSPLLILRL